MKVLVLNGSPKGEKSNTLNITKAFLDGCAESSEKLADAVNEFVLGALSEYVRPKS